MFLRGRPLKFVSHFSAAISRYQLTPGKDVDCYWRASVSWPARTYFLCVVTRCSLEDLPGTMDDRDWWREKEKKSQGTTCSQCDLMMTMMYIYIYKYVFLHFFLFTLTSLSLSLSLSLFHSLSLQLFSPRIPFVYHLFFSVVSFLDILSCIVSCAVCYRIRHRWRHPSWI